MDASTMIGAVEGLKSALSGLRTIKGMQVGQEVALKVDDVIERLVSAQQVLLEAQALTMQAQERAMALGRELEELRAWRATEEAHELVAMGGARVYLSRGMPRHAKCPACWSSKLVVALQLFDDGDGQCPKCQMTYRMGGGGRGPLRVETGDDDPFGRRGW